jgi:hypothetical protein
LYHNSGHQLIIRNPFHQMSDYDSGTGSGSPDSAAAGEDAAGKKQKEDETADAGGESLSPCSLLRTRRPGRSLPPNQSTLAMLSCGTLHLVGMNAVHRAIGTASGGRQCVKRQGATQRRFVFKS